MPGAYILENPAVYIYSQSKNIVSCDLKVSETTGSKQSQNSCNKLLFGHNIDEFEFNYVNINPQNSSLIQIPKTPTQNPRTLNANQLTTTPETNSSGTNALTHFGFFNNIYFTSKLFPLFQKGRNAPNNGHNCAKQMRQLLLQTSIICDQVLYPHHVHNL